jgi:fatty acyl-ACP thioesterase A
VGPDRGSSITTIANLLQEVAGNHAVALWGRTDAGYATDPIMVARNLIFAATRIQIQMDEYPKWGDMVQVETWFQEEGRVAATRNWLLRDALSGRPLGRATSTWVMVNTKTRRLAKMPDEMRAKMDLLAPNPARDSVPSSQARLKIPDLAFLDMEGGDEGERGSSNSDSGEASSSSSDSSIIEGPKQVARRADMDMNGHINNVTFLAWALETVPSDVYDGMSLSEVEIDYKSECLAGQTVECLAAPTTREKGTSTSDRKAPADAPGAKAFVHTLRRCDDERCYELVRARTTWRPAAGGKR